MSGKQDDPLVITEDEDDDEVIPTAFCIICRDQKPDCDDDDDNVRCGNISNGCICKAFVCKDCWPQTLRAQFCSRCPSCRAYHDLDKKDLIILYDALTKYCEQRAQSKCPVHSETLQLLKAWKDIIDWITIRDLEFQFTRVMIEEPDGLNIEYWTSAAEYEDFLP